MALVTIYTCHILSKSFKSIDALFREAPFWVVKGVLSFNLVDCCSGVLSYGSCRVPANGLIGNTCMVYLGYTLKWFLMMYLVGEFIKGKSFILFNCIWSSLDYWIVYCRDRSLRGRRAFVLRACSVSAPC